jgi:cAMP-dependent protein kinase regulator
MNEPLLDAIADGMEEIVLPRNHVIIEQGDAGDAFYVIMEGLTSVTHTKRLRSMKEAGKEIARLGKDAVFGEMSLITDEPRTATVTVISESARILKMSRQLFKDCMNSANNISNDVRMKIAITTISSHAMLQSLESWDRDKLIHNMNPVIFAKGSSICREGNLAHAFYIITEGLCGISVTQQDGLNSNSDNIESNQNKQTILKRKLYPGDVFGKLLACLYFKLC